MKDCIFCKIIEDKISSTKINESENFIAIYDAAPQIEGHTLIIPKKHFKTILNLPENFSNELLQFTKETSKKLMEKYHAEGFNLIINTNKSAGQIVDHFHLHILPRKKDDGMNLSLNKNGSGENLTPDLCLTQSKLDLSYENL